MYCGFIQGVCGKFQKFCSGIILLIFCSGIFIFWFLVSASKRFFSAHFRHRGETWQARNTKHDSHDPTPATNKNGSTSPRSIVERRDHSKTLPERNYNIRSRFVNAAKPFLLLHCKKLYYSCSRGCINQRSDVSL